MRRWWVYILIVGLSIWSMYKTYGNEYYAQDWMVYQRGYDDWRWIYPAYTLPLFQLWTNYYLWAGMLILSYCWIAHKLMELPYGTLWAIAGIKVFSFNLLSGQVQPLLVALSFHPLGACLALLVKPWFALPLALMALRICAKSFVKTHPHAHQNRYVNFAIHGPSLPSPVVPEVGRGDRFGAGWLGLDVTNCKYCRGKK